MRKLLVLLLAACSGPSVSVTTEPAGANCAAGGAKIKIGDAVQYACNGSNGTNGTNGMNGMNGMNASITHPFDADTLQGHPASDFLYTPGTGVSITSGAIAVDPTVVQSRVSGSCPAGQAVSAVAANGTVTCVPTTPYKNTIIVSGTGTPTANGTALRAAAMAATGTATQHTLIHIEPGTYDMGAQYIELPADVDVEGSGEGSTIILASGPGGVMIMRSDEPVELRAFTARSAYVGTFSTVISSGDAAGSTSGGLRRLSHLTLEASAGTMFNFGLSGGPQPLIVDDCTLTATGAGARAFFANLNQDDEIYNSRLNADQPALIQSGSLKIANTKINGSTQPGGAKCVNCFDVNFDPLGPACEPPQ